VLSRYWRDAVKAAALRAFTGRCAEGCWVDHHQRDIVVTLSL
jgi:hypothetical protein